MREGYHVNITPEFSEHTKKYFLSVKNKFHQTIFRKKLNNIIENIIGTIFIFGIIPIFASAEKLHVIIPFMSIELLLFLEFIVYIIIALNLNNIFNFISNFLLKGYLSNESIRFCYLQIAIDELNDYSTNDIPSHISTAYKSLKQYLKIENIHIPLSEDNRKEQPAYSIIKALYSKFDWFKLNNDADMIWRAFEKIETSLMPRIANGENIDQIIILLSYLKGYVYCNIEKSSKEELTIMGTTQNISTKEYGELLLLMFAEEMKLIEPKLEDSTIISRIIKTSFNNYSSKLYAFFQHNNILVCFISWLLTLAMIFGFISYLAISISGERINGQMIITGLVGIMAAATAFTVKFCRKN